MARRPVSAGGGIRAPGDLGSAEIDRTIAIILAGVVLRLLVSFVSIGTNDIFSWQRFADQMAAHGLLWMYERDPLWNHPPLMGYLAEGVRGLASALQWPFPPTFKLVPILADAVSAWLLWVVCLEESRDAATARRVLLLFVFSLNAILVSGYHGNTDPLVGCLVLAACVACDRGAFFRGGLLLAGAINVKLIPLLVIPLVIARADSRHVRRFAGGLALGLLPFVPIVWHVGDDFVRNAVAYRSNFDNWGIPLAIRALAPLGFPAATDVGAALYVRLGPILIIGAVMGLAAYARWKQWSSVYDRAALGLAIFLVLAPGFGVQYTAILGPVLFAASLRWGGGWALSSGVFALAVYATFSDGTFPLYSHFNSPFHWPAAAAGVVAWTLLACFIWASLRASRTPGPGGVDRITSPNVRP